MFGIRCKYTLRAVSEFVKLSEFSSRISSEELSKSLDFPKPLLSKILWEMARKNLISSVKVQTEASI
jgi:DNA-binding IscR family transcriptional regulator